MSIFLMTEAWKTTMPSTQKIVFLALCDNSSDGGECYPSITLLMNKCSLSDRAIQNAIAYLEEFGYLKREFRKGQSTTYWIENPKKWPQNDKEKKVRNRTNPRTKFTTEQNSPPNIVREGGEQCSGREANIVRVGGEYGSPITVIEPSIEPSVNRKCSSDSSTKKTTAKKSSELSANFMIETCDGLSESVATDFVQYRKTKRAPLNQTIWTKICDEIKKSGMSANDALTEAMLAGWQGVKAEWLINRSNKSQAQAIQQSNQLYRPTNGHSQPEQPMRYEVPNKIQVETSNRESDEVRARMAKSLDSLIFGAA